MSEVVSRPLRIQLWSYNYDPEPTGIGPVSTAWATGMRELGHQVEVVAAHAHYPEPRWGNRLLPYREVREGIPVLRLPLWIGRETALARYRQELTFMTAQTIATPFLRRPDVMVVVSPSFPALLPAVLHTRSRRIPWVLWLHDILPDGATATGIVDEQSPVIRLSRRLEQAAYRNADRIVVLSNAYIDNLVGKGAAPSKIEVIYDPATRAPNGSPRAPTTPARVLSMGNIGHTQGLAELVAAFEARPDLNPDVRMVITGSGVAAGDMRAAIRTDRVEMLGLVSDARLEQELLSATLGFVTQRYEGSEFNIPSKLMNFMAYGLPILAAVNPAGEVARIVNEAGAGWVVDSGRPEELPGAVAAILSDAEGIGRRSAAAREYAEGHFTREAFAQRFEGALQAVVRNGGGPAPPEPVQQRLRAATRS